MKVSTALTIAVLAIVLSTFFVWGLGRALDYENHCATSSGQCETP